MARDLLNYFNAKKHFFGSEASANLIDCFEELLSAFNLRMNMDTGIKM